MSSWLHGEASLIRPVGTAKEHPQPAVNHWPSDLFPWLLLVKQSMELDRTFSERGKKKTKKNTFFFLQKNSSQYVSEAKNKEPRRKLQFVAFPLEGLCLLVVMLWTYSFIWTLLWSNWRAGITGEPLALRGINVVRVTHSAGEEGAPHPGNHNYPQLGIWSRHHTLPGGAATNQLPWCLSQDRRYLISPRNWHFCTFIVKYYLSIYIYIYIWFFFFLAVSSSLWDLSSPSQASNLCPLHWEHWVPTTGPPGKSLIYVFFYYRLTAGYVFFK